MVSYHSRDHWKHHGFIVVFIAIPRAAEHYFLVSPESDATHDISKKAPSLLSLGASHCSQC